MGITGRRGSPRSETRHSVQSPMATRVRQRLLRALGRPSGARKPSGPIPGTPSGRRRLRRTQRRQRPHGHSWAIRRRTESIRLPAGWPPSPSRTRHRSRRQPISHPRAFRPGASWEAGAGFRTRTAEGTVAQAAQRPRRISRDVCREDCRQSGAHVSRLRRRMVVSERARSHV